MTTDRQTTTAPHDLLARAESYLSATHGSVARHDNLAVNLACAGCGLRDQIRAALAAPVLAPSAPVDRAAVLRDAADALDESETLRNLTDDHMHDVNAAANELRRMADEAQPAEPDTLAAWLYSRFINALDAPAWGLLTDADRTYWEHHARAVRRAVARGGFKAAGEPS